MEHDAVTLYESLPKSGKFKFMQCWYILRDSEKWGAWRASNGKRTSRKRSGSGQAVSQIDRSASADETVSTSTSDTQQVNEDDVSETREKGVSRAKMDRANLSLYARQVKVAERAALNAEKRIAVAQEHLELSLFTTQPDPIDALAAEYLALKKQAIIKRLRQETSNEDTTPTVSSSSEGTNAWVPSQNAAIRGSPESDSDPDITPASSNTDTTTVGGVIDSRVV